MEQETRSREQVQGRCQAPQFQASRRSAQDNHPELPVEGQADSRRLLQASRRCSQGPVKVQEWGPAKVQGWGPAKVQEWGPGAAQEVIRADSSDQARTRVIGTRE